MNLDYSGNRADEGGGGGLGDPPFKEGAVMVLVRVSGWIGGSRRSRFPWCRRL